VAAETKMQQPEGPSDLPSLQQLPSVSSSESVTPVQDSPVEEPDSPSTPKLKDSELKGAKNRGRPDNWRAAWRPEEDSLLLHSIKTYGRRWSVIQKNLHPRSRNQCRERFRTLARSARSNLNMDLALGPADTPLLLPGAQTMAPGPPIVSNLNSGSFSASVPRSFDCVPQQVNQNPRIDNSPRVTSEAPPMAVRTMGLRGPCDSRGAHVPISWAESTPHLTSPGIFTASWDVLEPIDPSIMSPRMNNWSRSTSSLILSSDWTQNGSGGSMMYESGSNPSQDSMPARYSRNIVPHMGGAAYQLQDHPPAHDRGFGYDRDRPPQ